MSGLVRWAVPAHNPPVLAPPQSQIVGGQVPAEAVPAQAGQSTVVVAATGTAGKVAVQGGRCALVAASVGTAAKRTPQTGAVAAVTTTTATQAALPGLIDGIEPESLSQVGPFIDSNGNLYRVTEGYTADTNRMLMLKSADGGVVWSRMDVAGGPTSGDLEGVCAIQVGTQIWSAWQKDNVRFLRFRTSDAGASPDTWVSAFQEISTKTDVGSFQNVSIGKLANDDAWFFLQADVVSTRSQISYRKRLADTTLQTETALDVTTGDWTSARAVVDSADLTYVFYKDHVNAQVLMRTLTSGGTLSGATRVDTTGTHTQATIICSPVYYETGGQKITVVAYLDSSANLKSIQVTDGTAGAEQTITSNVDVNPGTTVSNSVVAFLAVHGTTVHAVWADATSGDMLHATRAHGSAWSSPDTLWSSGADEAQWVYARTLVKPGGATVLGYTYDQGPHADDDSNIWYDELPLVATAAGSGRAATAVVATGMAVKVAVQGGICAVGAGPTGTAGKRTAQVGAVTATAASSGAAKKAAPQGGRSTAALAGIHSGVQTRAQSGICALVAAATGVERKLAAQVGRATAVAVSAGVAAKLVSQRGSTTAVMAGRHSGTPTRAQAGTCSLTPVGASVGQKVAPTAGRSAVAAMSAGTGKKSAPQAGGMTTVTVAAGVAKKLAPTRGLTTVIMTGRHSGVSARAQAGVCTAVPVGRATAVKNAVQYGAAAAVVASRGLEVKKAASVGAVATVTVGRSVEGRRATELGQACLVLGGTGVGGKRAPAVGRTHVVVMSTAIVLPAITRGQVGARDRPMPRVQARDRATSTVNARERAMAGVSGR